METYSPLALSYLIPYYHKKNADVLLMFFRMNNIGVFEACRKTREEFLQTIESQDFQEKFQTTFFTDNSTVFELQKYNKFALESMIQLTRQILSNFQFGNDTLLGGKSKTRRIRKQKGGATEAIQLFVDSVPYDGFLGIHTMKDVTLFILEQVIPSYLYPYFERNKGSFYCVCLVTFYVQHLVPMMIPFKKIQTVLREQVAEIQTGGTQSVPITLPSGKQLLPVQKRAGIRGKTLKKKKSPSQASIQQVVKSEPSVQVQKPTTRKAQLTKFLFASLLLFDINALLTYQKTPEEKAFGNLALVLPNTGAMLEMHTLYNTPDILDGVVYQQTRPSFCELGTNGRFYCGRGNNSVKNKPNTTNNNAKQQIPITGERKANVCFASIPFPNNPENNVARRENDTVSFFVDGDFVLTTQYIHAVSARNVSAGEYSVYFTVDETGRLSPNATIATSFKRGETCLPGGTGGKIHSCAPSAQIPENAAMWWHFHPWDVHNRFNSHFSGADLRVAVGRTIYGGVPYGAAHAPEGLYVYSLQKSTLDFIRNQLNEAASISKARYQDVSNEMVKKINDNLNDALSKLRPTRSLDCDDLRSRNITQYNNLYTVEYNGKTVDVGFDIQFYNQKHLSQGNAIYLPEYENFKSIPTFYGPKIAPSPPMPAATFWDTLFRETFSSNLSKKIGGPSEFTGLSYLPNPFEQKVSSQNLRAAHGGPVEGLVKVLQNPDLFQKFQYDVNKQFEDIRYNNTKTDIQKSSIIEQRFNKVYSDILPKLLSEPVGKYIETSAPYKGTDWLSRTLRMLRQIHHGFFQVELNPTEQNLVLLRNSPNLYQLLPQTARNPNL